MAVIEHGVPRVRRGAHISADRSAILAPVLVVAAILGLLVWVQLAVYHGDPAGFVVFGQRLTHSTHPPAGAPVTSPSGYDGQIYWLQAHDPLLVHRSTLNDLHNAEPGYRLQRPAYPALAYLLAAGQAAALPWTLLGINVVAIIALTAAFSAYCRRRGWSCWWALAAGLAPGLLLASLRDLSDVMATTTMLAGLLTWQSGRRWTTAALLAVSALTREPMALAVLAIAVDAVARSWRRRDQHGAWRRGLAQVWPVLLLPAAAVLGWQVYIHAKEASVAAATGPPVGLFSGYVNEVRTMIKHQPAAIAVWDTVYVSLMAVGSLVALWLLRRRVSAAGVAAVLFAATLTIIVFGDQWGDTRYSAPMFGALLIAGLELQSRSALTVCTLVTGMSLFLPVVAFGVW